MEKNGFRLRHEGFYVLSQWLVLMSSGESTIDGFISLTYSTYKSD